MGSSGSAFQGQLKIIGTDTDRSRTYDFLLMFRSNHGPILYRLKDSEISVKNCEFSPPNPLLTPQHPGFPRNCVTAPGFKKLEWQGYQAEKKVDGIFVRFGTTYECGRRTDRRTDGRTDTGRRLVPRLRIASRLLSAISSTFNRNICFMAHYILQKFICKLRLFETV